jgi:AcrR family transcriptional regulator
MSRWEPDARQRLERAALELFVERGFEQTTVPDITARAGLTTRTFFRHFADKREVLFGDEDQIPALASRLVLDAPIALGPMAVVQYGLPGLAASAFEGRLEQLRQHKAIVDSNDGLRERELRKLQKLTNAIAEAFRRRGVDDLTAAVVAETAVGIVHVALGRWIDSGGDQSLTDLMSGALRRLRRAFDDVNVMQEGVNAATAANGAPDVVDGLK